MLVLNLKMNASKKEIMDLKEYIKDKDVIVLPQAPFYYLFDECNCKLGAQNVSKYIKGNYTGEISAKNLKDMNVQYCLIGHAERCLLFNETIQEQIKKVINVLSYGITPILCINETEEEYNEDLYKNKVDEYLKHIPNNINLVIAYEQCWMIASNSNNINIKHIEENISYLKQELEKKNINYNIIYGGGVNKANIDELYNLDNLSGFIIGTSSFKCEDLDYIYTVLNNSK